ncbi:hypothetical protein D3C71_1115960 [compost metagenome]
MHPLQVRAATGAVGVAADEMGAAVVRVVQIVVAPDVLVLVVRGDEVAAAVGVVLVDVGGQLAHGLGLLHQPQALDTALFIKGGADMRLAADDVRELAAFMAVGQFGGVAFACALRGQPVADGFVSGAGFAVAPEHGGQLEGLDVVAPVAEDQEAIVATPQGQVLDGIVVGLARLIFGRPREPGEFVRATVGTEVAQASVLGLFDACGVRGGPARAKVGRRRMAALQNRAVIGAQARVVGAAPHDGHETGQHEVGVHEGLAAGGIVDRAA